MLDARYWTNQTAQLATSVVTTRCVVCSSCAIISHQRSRPHSNAINIISLKSFTRFFLLNLIICLVFFAVSLVTTKYYVNSDKCYFMLFRWGARAREKIANLLLIYNILRTVIYPHSLQECTAYTVLDDQCIMHTQTKLYIYRTKTFESDKLPQQTIWSIEPRVLN